MTDEPDGINDTSRDEAVITVEQVATTGVNESTVAFMEKCCTIINSYSDDLKPIVMMAIINACAYLVDSEGKLVDTMECIDDFIMKMVLLDLHSTSMDS
jgi:hypothetical protein